MKLKKIALGTLAVVAIAGTAGWFSLDKETRGLIATVPTNKDLLFWSQPQRDAAFRALDRISLLAKWRDIPAGGSPSAAAAGAAAEAVAGRGCLPGRPAQRRADRAARRQAAPGALRAGLRQQRALDQLLGGQVHHLDAGGCGTARRPIRSMDDKVSDYIPQMKGSAYDDVSIRQLLTMTSGVKLERGLRDPNSDVARFNNHKPEEGVDALVSYLRKLPREVPPGRAGFTAPARPIWWASWSIRPRRSRWPTTCRRRSGCPPAWSRRPPGSSRKTGQEISGCCIQAAPATSRASGCSS
jgi:hypothetical protein